MVEAGIKKSVLLCMFIICGLSINAQIIESGKITFERRTNLYKKFPDDRMKSYIKDKDKIRIEDFVLYFNDTASTFRPIYSEEADPLNWTTTKNTVVQNANERNKLVVLGFAGQEVLVGDSMVPRQWKITENTRVIAGYKCRKAVYEKNDSTKLYAWYCIEIVPSFGPEGFDGLPGMILGLATEDGGIIYFAKKVEVIAPTAENLIVETKKKTIYTMPELKTKLEKDFANSPWGKRLFDDLFRWL